MTITSFNELKTVLQEVMEDDSAEVSAYMDTAIFLAEEKISKALDLRTQIAVTSSNRAMHVSIPGGGLETIVSTCIEDDGFLYFNDVFQCGKKLDYVAYSATKEVNRFVTSNSIGVSAELYAFRDDPGRVYIAPACSGAVYEFNYTKRPNKLSPAVPSNDILVKAPDLLFYASMVEMSLFLKNWETLSVWQGLYNTSLESHLNVSRRERQDEGQKHQATGLESQSTTGIN